MDTIGKKVSTIAATTVRAANSLAILGRYDRQLWSDISPYIEMLSEPARAEARRILQEGEQMAAEIIDAAVDVASTGFRQLAGATVLRRQGWLKSTSFRPEVQTKIIDMPFDGEHLFGQHVEDALATIKKDTETAKSLGTLQFRKSTFRGARGKGTFSTRRNFAQQGSFQSFQSSNRYQGQRQQQYGQRNSTYQQNKRKTSFRGRDTTKKQ